MNTCTCMLYVSVALSRWTNLSPQRCRVKLSWSATMATAVCGWGPWLSTTCGTLTATWVRILNCHHDSWTFEHCLFEQTVIRWSWSCSWVCPLDSTVNGRSIIGQLGRPSTVEMARFQEPHGGETRTVGKLRLRRIRWHYYLAFDLQNNLVYLESDTLIYIWVDVYMSHILYIGRFRIFKCFVLFINSFLLFLINKHKSYKDYAY